MAFALKKPLSRFLLLVPLTLTAVLAWAFFWPDQTCSDPACARKRFKLFVELDSFQGIDPIPLEVDTPTETVSVHKILLSGGIDTDIHPDEDRLPYSPESGPLDRADLYQYALVWRNKAPPSKVDGQIYAMITPSLVSDRGERLFGIMFDSAGREGIAIAPRQTERTFAEREPDAIPILQVRTFVHEMLHALNRRHLDAAQMRDGRVTLEAPTRCLTGQAGGAWYLIEQPLMALSPSTIRFFQTAEPRDVLPGGANTPFEGLRSSANECADVRSNRLQAGADSRWEFARRRLFGLLGIQSAQAQDETEAFDPEPSPPAVMLRVQAQEAAYPLGYPIAVRLMVRNDSDTALPLRGRLAPAYGLVQIQYRFKDEEQWQAYKPLAWFEAADDEAAMLEPGGYFEQTAPIYFGDDGWTFAQPGEYELRATLHAGEGGAIVTSEIIPIRIAEPSGDERAVLETLLDDSGMLDADVGRLLTFGGRIDDAVARESVREAADNHSDTALGSALRLTLASQRLNPPIDPLTGERRPPDISDAEELLRDTCSDSGIAALKHELLARFADQLPADMLRHLPASAEAWDGIAARNERIATYSDPTLRKLGTTLHFCTNDARLRGQVREQAWRIARELRRDKPQRIVLVGHADFRGHCRFNDELGLDRAESVARLLRAAGIPRDRIRTVTLGERRPVDFASAEEARRLNRRVEILVESHERESPQPEDAPLASEQIERALPECED